MDIEKKRVKAVIAYDGSSYFGFQKQTSTKQTVTYDIENALNSLHIESPIVASGRTDAGVHATAQIIHFDLPDFWVDLNKLKINLNRKLTNIQFKHISFVPENFHARFSAKKRTYRYVFKTKKPSIFEQKYISFYENFNENILIDALKVFEGEHDFKNFHKTGTVTHTTIRKIYKTTYIKRGDYHFIYFQGNSFLRSQIRMMVNAAMLCAKDELSKDCLEKQLECKDKYTTRLAPPQGLYLSNILY
ncbi:tRNA pseudouridine synthase A [hydrothermal vent metagenome]|uniref:tRNA pseudouridine synthase A n=1 Tax=hydrothermal vent metagenome TaxID=652676 RepID=A0A1W1EC03_9ZZZZ